MKQPNKNAIKTIIRAGINRFIGEDAPFWSKEDLTKLIEPLTHEDVIVKNALSEMELDKEIYLVKDDNVYFFVTEQYISKTIGNNNILGQHLIDVIIKLKIQFHISDIHS